LIGIAVVPPEYFFFHHAREGGHPVITDVCVYWIPAFAGMTPWYLARAAPITPA
jgi:hypothetical protein